MKRVLTGLAAFVLVFSVFFASRAKEQPALYTGQMRITASAFKEMDSNSGYVYQIPEKRRVEILQVEPAWLLIRYKNYGTAWIRRQHMDDTTVRPVNPQATAPYAAVENRWLAFVASETGIMDLPDSRSKTLETLTEGARIALVDISDGWGRLIHHRQWAYIDTRQLSEILPLNLLMDADNDAPLAAYTSFYRTTTDESNLNRMINLQVACDRFQLYVLQPGERMDFNAHIGPYSRKVGYLPANALVEGEVKQSYGGGTCQVSSTLYNVLLQMPGLRIVHRRAHGPSAAPYLPHGADAAVGNKIQNLIFKNNYDFPVRLDGTVQDGALTIAVYRAE